MFDQGHQVGFSNCKALVRVLYLDLDLNCLPPSSIDMAKFIMKLVIDLSLCQHLSPWIIILGERFLRELGNYKEPTTLTKGVVEPDNEGGQLSKIGSWSDSNNQQLLGMIVTASEAKEN